jgi:hypothetical protein
MDVAITKTTFGVTPPPIATIEKNDYQIYTRIWFTFSQCPSFLDGVNPLDSVPFRQIEIWLLLLYPRG